MALSLTQKFRAWQPMSPRCIPVFLEPGSLGWSITLWGGLLSSRLDDKSSFKKPQKQNAPLSVHIYMQYLKHPPGCMVSKCFEFQGVRIKALMPRFRIKVQGSPLY